MEGRKTEGNGGIGWTVIAGAGSEKGRRRGERERDGGKGDEVGHLVSHLILSNPFDQGLPIELLSVHHHAHVIGELTMAYDLKNVIQTGFRFERRPKLEHCTAR
jgi:hypothetical protein